MKKLGIISLFILLFVSFVLIWDYSYFVGQQKAALVEVTSVKVHEPSTSALPSERGVFRRAQFALDYAAMPVDKNHQRTLKTYYNNRAYPGAPPTIPHPVKDDHNIGGNTCLQCHKNGGFVAKYNAYTPVTPHPDMINCRQCHVKKTTSSTFKGTNFHKIAAPKVGINSALKGSPPIIPHAIQMRENCLSCHAGPSAAKEIRTSHPDRINCRQCHVLNNKQTVDIGTFIRNHNE